MERSCSSLVSSGILEKGLRKFNSRCMAGSLLAVISIVGTPRAASATHSPWTAECTEVPGIVTFQGLEVVPAKPEVGDDVQLNFHVGFQVYGVGTVWLLQAGVPLLEGNMVLGGTRAASFRLKAAQAGTTSVAVEVTYHTEELCDRLSDYRYGPDHTVTSPYYSIEIAEPPCPADCNDNGEVDIDELIRGVSIALGDQSLDSCAALDRDRDGIATINDLITAVNAALLGCPPKTPPTPPPTPTNPPGACCCGNFSFIECQAVARDRSCIGWSDPCPTPTPSPESGVCYEQVDCAPLPFATRSNRAFCCDLAGRGGSFTWCSEMAIDPATGLCTDCVYPCPLP